MMDLSDGLSRDLPRLCRSSGVGAVLEAEQIPIHADADGAGSRTPLEQALHDGEDFELLLAHDALDPAQEKALQAAGIVLWPIGRVTSEAEGVLLLENDRRVPLLPLGYDHLGAQA